LFFSTHNVISLIICPLCKNWSIQYKALKSLLKFYVFLYTQMWSLSSFVPCVKMINTIQSSQIPPSDFVFFVYTQCDLSHPLSLCVSKWSIQEAPTHLRSRTTTSQEVPHQLLGTYPNLNHACKLCCNIWSA
jgi:hypothetical protein